MIKRVACALSGGVDSSVSAFLLKSAGFDVVGVYMNNWDQVEEGTSNCPRSRDLVDVEKVCDLLQIRLSVVDFSKEYWNKVFENLLKGYQEGRTVVADVECNSLIKFSALHAHAREVCGADVVATGHYAQNSWGNLLERKSSDPPKLLTAVDPIKDQTYFLSRLDSAQLTRSMFPVGHMFKGRVRDVAKQAGLSVVVEKKESMGLCYVGKRKDFGEFLRNYIPDKDGPILEYGTNREVGRHNGVHYFTIGKRVALTRDHPTHYGFYVVDINPNLNQVYVCRGSHHSKLFARHIQLEQPHWINDIAPDLSRLHFRCQRIHPTIKCKVDSDNRLSAQIPIRAAAPGQYCVFYEDNVCLGSASIKSVISTL